MCWESTISQKFLLSEETISKLIVIRFKQDSVLAFLRDSHRFFIFYLFDRTSYILGCQTVFPLVFYVLNTFF